MQDVEEMTERCISVWLVKDFTSVAFTASCATGLWKEREECSNFSFVFFFKFQQFNFLKYRLEFTHLQACTCAPDSILNMGEIESQLAATAPSPPSLERPKFPDFAAELSFRHDCAADQCDVGLGSKISNNICPANNRKGVHSKIKLFVAARPPTLDGMTVEQRNSLPSCAVGKSRPR